MSVRPTPTLKQLITAVRAFHIGLVAETERQLSTLRRVSESIETLRGPGLDHQKRAAIKTSWRHLGGLRSSWHSTYRDLRRSLIQLYVGLDGKPDDLAPRRRRP
jgi:hypothetical protein